VGGAPGQGDQLWLLNLKTHESHPDTPPKVAETAKPAQGAKPGAESSKPAEPAKPADPPKPAGAASEAVKVEIDVDGLPERLV
jgi:hypothetical protein